MDSRIRELEHRLERAKEGLAGGDREDYLKQLYLLDAEIRAAIRQNGAIPDHLKELLGDRSEKRRFTPSLTAGMAFAAMVLVAAVTFVASWYFQPVAEAGSGFGPKFETQATRQVDPSTGSRALPADEPVLTVLPEYAELDEPAVVLAAAEENLTEYGITEEMPVVPADQRRTQVLTAAAPAEILNNSNAGQTDTIAVNLVPPMLETPQHEGVKLPGGNLVPTGDGKDVNPLNRPDLFSPLQSSGFDWTIARFALPVADENRDKEIPVVVSDDEEEKAEHGSEDNDKEEPARTDVDKKLSTSDKDVDK